MEPIQNCIYNILHDMGIAQNTIALKQELIGHILHDEREWIILMFKLETTFKIEIPPTQEASIRTIEDCVHTVCQLINNRQTKHYEGSTQNQHPLIDNGLDPCI